MTTVAFVGLGAMGSRIAGRLLDAGHRVHGTNRTKSRAAALIERGLVWHDTPREAAAQATIVFSMVTDDAALREIMAGPSGILAGLRPGSVFIDMSTVSPRTSAAVAEWVHEAGAEMVDAPVSGSVAAAEDGSLAIMVGGEAAIFARIDPLLREIGSVVTHVGANGDALVMKLAVNISLAVQMIAFGEGVLLAEQAGIARKLAVEVLSSSAIGSPMLQGRGPLVLERPSEAWFDVTAMQKDISLALEQGRSLKVPLPSAALANELLTAARALGYGNQDMSAVFDVLALLAGHSGSALR